jgi:hypothetical protein
MSAIDPVHKRVFVGRQSILAVLAHDEILLEMNDE